MHTAARSRPQFALCVLLTLLGCGCLIEPQEQVTDHTTERPVFDDQMPAAFLDTTDVFQQQDPPQPASSPAKLTLRSSTAADSESGDARSLIQSASIEKSTPATSPTSVHTGYTGAKVYVSESCPPCEVLQQDLLMLCQHHKWSLQYLTADNADEARADWVIIRNSNVGRYPLIEYWDRGKVVDAIAGYVSGDVAPDTRDHELRLRIRAHPFSQRSEASQ